MTKRRLETLQLEKFQTQEVRVENERLTQLLDLKRAISQGLGNVIYARVVARTPEAWNKVFLVDKGFEEKVSLNLPVFSSLALVGKIVEVGPHASKALLITDPDCKIAVLIQRTRHQGVLYGTTSGECRVKYLSVDAQIMPGDLVETAGLGGFFPKGVPVGRVVRVWKEPGQIYQVAQIKPLVDLNRIEEVALLDRS